MPGYYIYGAFDRNASANPRLSWGVIHESDLNYHQFYPVLRAINPDERNGEGAGHYNFNREPPDRFEWVGAYIPIIFDEGGTAYRVGNETQNPYDAYLQARQWRTDHNFSGGVSIAFSGPQNRYYVRRLLEVCGETLDDEPAFEGKTICNSDETVGTACSKCGIPGHNRRTCAALEDIDKVGIEIEGRWVDIYAARNTAQEFDATSCSDGSLHRVSGYNTLEFQTKPGSAADSLKQLVALYPDHTGPDCGMHVHVSFKCSTHFTQLSCQAFFDYFKQRWTAWGTANRLSPNGEFFKRLRGENQYCLPNIEVSNPYREDRYRQLNFSAFNEHKTVECRLLPMFRSRRLAISAVLELVSIYKDWLSTNTLALPEVSPNLETPDYGLSLALVPPEIDLESYGIGFGALNSSHHSQTVEINEVSPPAEGMRRIVATPATVAYLQALLAA